jgi:hypothetical protein
MDRPRLIRALRIAWSVWWGILCVLLIVLWVRSYRERDFISRIDNNRWRTTLGSNNGYVYLDHRQIPLLPGFGYWSASAGWKIHRSDPIIYMPAVFYWHSTASETDIRVPYRYLAPIVLAIFASFAVLPWVPRKFSLRTLLIATTLIAVVLGLMVYTTR